jgi:hypothetical protein
MTRERDLFRAIVVSAVALVGPAACGGREPEPADSSAARIDSGGEDPGMLADAGIDSSVGSDSGPIDASEEAKDAGMVLIL